MIVYPEIDPIIFSIGVVKIRWYGLMYVVGFLFAWWLARRRTHLAHSQIKDEQHADDLIFYAMLGVILGGRLGHVLFYSSTSFVDDPLYLFKIWEGGMAFHGGLVGVMVAMWLFGRKHKLKLWQVTDFMAPMVPLGLGFGRIGNFINGELWGKPTDSAWGVLYQGQVLHASQLYEAVLEGFLLFVDVPAATALREQLMRSLVNLVHIWPLFAVDFDIDEQLVHQFGRGLILKRLVGHDVAPVTGRVANREQYRFARLLCQFERLAAPRIPVDRIVGVLQQVGAGFVGEAVAHGLL